MKGFTAAFLIWTLISPNGGGKAWPTHTACRDGSLEVLYESCDPLQDFGFSVDECSKQLKSNINIRFGIILREDIEELFLDIALFSKGSSILNFSYPVCEDDLPKFSFCGRRKGARQCGNCCCHYYTHFTKKKLSPKRCPSKVKQSSGVISRFNPAQPSSGLAS
ncbi:lymphocyte antigen 86 isoform X1 [Manis javanica]|uniref:lymphocyte antigen 86 isoform X1 n=1 Tax=Manis javanica TaxID=9974 RepID=UPI003C6D73C3